MKAARLHAYRQPLVVERVATPRPGPGQVLVRVDGSGFCHSDVHIIDGELQILPRFPLTLGHESAGTVERVGEGVLSTRPGDRVLVYGGWGCGLCDACVSGDEQLCDKPEWVGLSQWDGGYAEYLLVPRERYLVKLSVLEPRVAAPLADAALTPYRAVKRAMPYLQPDHAVLLIGLGGLGQYGLELLRLLTGCELIVIDASSEKLELARKLGADHVLLAKAPELEKRVLEITHGSGVVASFDFVGSEATLELAVRSTRARGKVTQVGLAGGTARLHVLENSRFEVAFEATLWGNLKELREVVALAERGRLRMTHVEFARLEDIQDVYARVKSGRVAGRVVLTPAA